MSFASDKSVTYRHGKADDVMAHVGAYMTPAASPGRRLALNAASALKGFTDEHRDDAT